MNRAQVIKLAKQVLQDKRHRQVHVHLDLFGANPAPEDFDGIVIKYEVRDDGERKVERG